MNQAELLMQLMHYYFIADVQFVSLQGLVTALLLEAGQIDTGPIEAALAVLGLVAAVDHAATKHE